MSSVFFIQIVVLGLRRSIYTRVSMLKYVKLSTIGNIKHLLLCSWTREVYAKIIAETSDKDTVS